MTNAEARFNKSLRPRKPEGSLGRTAQDVHHDSHTAPELLTITGFHKCTRNDEHLIRIAISCHRPRYLFCCLFHMSVFLLLLLLLLCTFFCPRLLVAFFSWCLPLHLLFYTTRRAFFIFLSSFLLRILLLTSDGSFCGSRVLWGDSGEGGRGGGGRLVVDTRV